jgi:hypothetical protein
LNGRVVLLYQLIIIIQQLIMKKLLFLPLFFCFMYMGFGQTNIVNSWVNPNITSQNLGVHKMVVAALLYDQGVRREVEDYIVNNFYSGMATQSYLLIGDSLITNEAAESQKLMSLGFDGIFILKRSGNENQQAYVPGQAPTEWTTWGGYWGYWGGPRLVTHYNSGTPGHTVNVYTGLVQVNIYSFKANTLLYSANTSTTRPGGAMPLFEDVVNAVNAQLNANGLLIPN